MNAKTERYKGAALALARWGHRDHIPARVCYGLVLGVDVALKRRDYPAALRLMLHFRAYRALFGSGTAHWWQIVQAQDREKAQRLY